MFDLCLSVQIRVQIKKYPWHRNRDMIKSCVRKMSSNICKFTNPLSNSYLVETRICQEWRPRCLYLMNDIIPIENITALIYLIRGEKVMLDRDLAALYGVETKRLKEQVKRNIERFPEDFMFELSKSEFANWRSQFATSKRDKIGLRYSPMAFTEQGVAMLSSVLRSKIAIQVNMRSYVGKLKISERIRMENSGLSLKPLISYWLLKANRKRSGI